MLIQNHRNRESNSRSSQFTYTDVMNNMKLLSVVTPLSIYNGCSTQKKFWEENFTQVNMKNGGRRNVSRPREIKNSEHYIALEIYLKFGNLENMNIISSEPRDYLGRSGKRLSTSLGINTIIRSKILKRKGFPLMKSVLRIFLKLLRNLRVCLLRVM